MGTEHRELVVAVGQDAFGERRTYLETSNEEPKSPRFSMICSHYVADLITRDEGVLDYMNLNFSSARFKPKQAYTTINPSFPLVAY
jgi:hypothetical protein